MPAKANPYLTQHPRNYDSKGEAPGPVQSNTHPSAYAATSMYVDEWDDGYSTELDPSGASGTTPDLIRSAGKTPPLNDPNDREYYEITESEFLSRMSVEEVKQHWREKQQKVAGGQNPLWTQERAPTRATAELAPASYQFTRPWHIPRQIQDAVGEDAVTHLSMADHRRAYEIFGMAPRGGLGVNSYRIDPEPWDESLFYTPQPDVNLPGGPRGVYGGDRSFRLG